MIKSVRHTGVVVRDLEKAANFYRALGFIDSNQAIEEGKFIDQVTGLINTKLEWIKLKAPDGYLLELLQYHSHLESEEVTMQRSGKNRVIVEGARGYSPKANYKVTTTFCDGNSLEQ